uniref:Uncharacterized protein n=1 Tax=viral metagenome TaxID=1070528 RepID=A0A6M3IS78_9ZZZZ
MINEDDLRKDIDRLKETANWQGILQIVGAHTAILNAIKFYESYLSASKEFPKEKHGLHEDEANNAYDAGFNEARELCLLACVKGRMSEEEIRNIIIDTVNKEGKRNNGDNYKGHDYSIVCSCGNCHLAHIVAHALWVALNKEEVWTKNR